MSAAMPAYDAALSLRDARQQYFERSGFSEAGYRDKWVVLKAGGVVVLAFPNTASRVRSVKLHDLHHVATEYDTTWTGESEIGAWELASGCAKHYPAWILNFGALAIGLVIAPRRTYRAFIRGRHSGNLYRSTFSEELLDRTVGDLRSELRLETIPNATTADKLAFMMWAAAAAFYIGLHIAAAAFAVWLTARIVG